MEVGVPPCEAKRHWLAFAPQSEQCTQVQLDRLSFLALGSGYIKYILMSKVILGRNVTMLKGLFQFSFLFCFPQTHTHFWNRKKDAHVQSQRETTSHGNELWPHWTWLTCVQESCAAVQGKAELSTQWPMGAGVSCSTWEVHTPAPFRAGPSPSQACWRGNLWALGDPDICALVYQQLCAKPFW